MGPKRRAWWIWLEVQSVILCQSIQPPCSWPHSSFLLSRTFTSTRGSTQVLSSLLTQVSDPPWPPSPPQSVPNFSVTSGTHSSCLGKSLAGYPIPITASAPIPPPKKKPLHLGIPTQGSWLLLPTIFLKTRAKLLSQIGVRVGVPSSLSAPERFQIYTLLLFIFKARGGQLADF